ncbi:MAG TPA: MaoC/PaaZ C-terminal domain-containing protein, partial [Sinorhizobium sp.]|nr:MaoC/PaaZ C-terminal domain-containing protein [Sinorhizobium sp.]
MPHEISLSEVKALIGKEIGVSDWITVTQKTIDNFAEATGDFQFIHTDPVRAAAETPFG